MFTGHASGGRISTKRIITFLRHVAPYKSHYLKCREALTSGKPELKVSYAPQSLQHSSEAQNIWLRDNHLAQQRRTQMILIALSHYHQYPRIPFDKKKKVDTRQAGGQLQASYSNGSWMATGKTGANRAPARRTSAACGGNQQTRYIG